MKKVLNIGGNSRNIKIPEFYDGWQNVILDIDPKCNPDICCDARSISLYTKDKYDSIYCSHNLEHYYRHDAKKVLFGFTKILKSDGFIFIRVPDIMAVIQRMIDHKLDIEDTLYDSAAGPIRSSDVIFGFQKEIEDSGNDYFAHKNGFTSKSLQILLGECGFNPVYVCKGPLELWAYVFVNPPSKPIAELLNLPI